MERFIYAQIKVIGKSIRSKNILSFTNPSILPCEVLPKFVVASLDIETGENNTRLYSIAVHITGNKKELKQVFVVGK